MLGWAPELSNLLLGPGGENVPMQSLFLAGNQRSTLECRLAQVTWDNFMVSAKDTGGHSWPCEAQSYQHPRMRSGGQGDCSPPPPSAQYSPSQRVTQPHCHCPGRESVDQGDLQMREYSVDLTLGPRAVPGLWGSGMMSWRSSAVPLWRLLG